MLKDAIDEHREKNIEATDKEQREMADAAYQTIKTLQEMLEVKSESVRRKEEQVQKMRLQLTN